MIRALLCELLRFWRTGVGFLRHLCGRSAACFLRIRTFHYFRLPWSHVRERPQDPESHSDNDPKDPRSHREEAEDGERERPAGSSQEPADSDECEGEECRVDTADDLYCGYDSTWETEEPQGRGGRVGRAPTGSVYHKFNRFKNAARDLHEYRHDYPQGRIRRRQWTNSSSSQHIMPNLEFYVGQRPSVPDEINIYDFHKNWYGNYEKLEHVHTFIQWLFPLQEPGMNSAASTLTKEEIKAFLRDNIAKKNLLMSYKLMMDFYGIMLVDENTGKVEKAPNWKVRFDNLNSNTHNCLRITRILKCLGTLGYPHYQFPLVHFFLRETLEEGQLPRVKESVLNYFVFAVLDKKQRRRLIRFAYSHYEPKDEFVWCPKKIQMIWSKQDAGKGRAIYHQPSSDAEMNLLSVEF